MTRFTNTKLRAFLRNEDGSAMTIEFVLWVPLFLILMIATLEMGAMTIRHTQLERGLDYAVRDLRLGTGTAPNHTEVKQNICDAAPILADCESMLQLEMIPLDLRSWSNPPQNSDCIDATRDVNPLRQFEAGQDNQLMYLRACYKYQPIAPLGALAGSLYADSEGYTRIVSFSAFVQEPSI